MPKPVVVTRPLQQAEALASRVRAMGRDAVVFPLLEILPLQDTAALRAALQRLDEAALAAFVSPNAVDAVVAAGLQDWPALVAIAVVGEGSRAALARHGIDDGNARIFSPRDPARSDSEGLLEVLDLEALRGRKVMIFRGESGRELFADALRAAGALVEPVPAYRRLAPALDATRRLQLMQMLEQRHEWIVTSSEALRNLVTMAEQLSAADVVAKMQQQSLIVSHARIAETARELGFQDITLTGSGDEQLIAALQSRA